MSTLVGWKHFVVTIWYVATDYPPQIPPDYRFVTIQDSLEAAKQAAEESAEFPLTWSGFWDGISDSQTFNEDEEFPNIISGYRIMRVGPVFEDEKELEP